MNYKKEVEFIRSLQEKNKKYLEWRMTSAVWTQSKAQKKNTQTQIDAANLETGVISSILALLLSNDNNPAESRTVKTFQYYMDHQNSYNKGFNSGVLIGLILSGMALAILSGIYYVFFY